MPTKKRKSQKRKINPLRLLLVALIALALLAGVFFLIVKVFGSKEPAPPSVETIDPAEAEEEQSSSEESGAVSPQTQDGETRVSLFFTGDGLLHESVYMDAMNSDGSFDFAKQLDRITDIASKYDLQFYNQETILGGTDLGLSGYPVFNSPQEFGSYMVSKGSGPASPIPETSGIRKEAY